MGMGLWSEGGLVGWYGLDEWTSITLLMMDGYNRKLDIDRRGE
jgi:hypothetical protein